MLRPSPSRLVLGLPGGPVAVVEGQPAAVAAAGDHLPLAPVPATANPDLVLTVGRRRPANVRLRIDASGSPWTVEGPDAGAVVPLTTAMINVLAVRRGLLPLHCVAFEHTGRVVAVTGWRGSGKTAALLQALVAGGRPIAAEWVYVSAEGLLLTGAHPIRVKPHHLPVARSAGLLNRSQVLRLDLAQRTGKLAGRAPGGRAAAGALLRRVWVDVAVDGSAPAGPVRLDELRVLGAFGQDKTSLARISPAHAAPRLAAAFAEDLAPLAAALRAMTFAARSDVGLDDVYERYRAMLLQRLDMLTVAAPGDLDPRDPARHSQ